MFRKLSLSVFLSFQIAVHLLEAASLNPKTPVAITSDGSLGDVPYMAANSSGYVALWADNGHHLITSFSSDQGQTWSTPFDTGYYGSFPVTVSANESGYVAASIDSLAHVQVTSSSNGFVWSMPLTVSSASTTSPSLPVSSAASSLGFMVAWQGHQIKSSGTLMWTSFSADGLSWNTSVSAPASGNVVAGTPRIAGTSAGFLGTYNSSNQGFATFSMDGTSWSTPVPITPSSALLPGTSIAVAGRDSTFMVAWLDAINSLHTSVSKDNGATWETTISTGFVGNGVSNVSLASAETGFILTWVGIDSRPYAAFTADLGSQWSAPVQLTSSVISSDTFPTPAVATFAGGCIFAWLSSDLNAISCFTNVPTTSGGPSIIPIFKQINLNKPSGGIYQ